MNYINLKRYIARWLRANPDAETALLLVLTATFAVAEEAGCTVAVKALQSFDPRKETTK